MKPERRLARAAAVLSSTPAANPARYFIEDVYPSVDGGRWPVKRIVGETIDLWADIFRDGHDVTAAALLWRKDGEDAWRREPMRHVSNDRWAGQLTLTEPGRYTFAFEAWTDEFATWQRDIRLKLEAGQDVSLELQEGRALLAEAGAGSDSSRRIIAAAVKSFDKAKDPSHLLQDALAAAMQEAQARPDLTTSQGFPLTIDRERARSGAWYEFFPRSQGTVADMLFDCIR